MAEVSARSEQSVSGDPIGNMDGSTADQAGSRSQPSSAASGQVTIANSNDFELAQDLLLIVSRRLFIALAVLLGLGGLIVFSVAKSQTEALAIAVTPSIVVLCGIVGGFVGIQRRLKDLTIRDLQLLENSWTYLLLAPFVGGVLALVLYLLFVSGLLRGDLFPAFVEHEGKHELHHGFATVLHQHGKEGFSDYAKLMFWCFVAGFSERFVIDVIGRFEGNAVKSIKPKHGS